ncbi:hypothetical protein [uncultured Microbacterium sp.]|uniref:PIN-like domain-containing protein n=1 Tax=uncultured Microbacterium sp. TaxID=191216 RepID=UPI0025E3B3E8|nr:hypothetical protein [uncultured Microbacterium sp.]
MTANGGRPKFFIDENLPADYAELLRRPFKSALYKSYLEESLRGTQDVTLFPELRQRGFTAILTQDRRQLFYEEERDGLRAAGLHWVGLVEVKGRGLRFHSQALGMLAAALPDLIAQHDMEPHAFYITPDHTKPLLPLQVERI